MSALVATASLAAAALAGHAALNARRLRTPPPARPIAGHVSVLIPARDEAANIGGCLQAVLASRHVDLEVLVLDDGSHDATPAIVRAFAARDSRLRLLTGAGLPPGWLGKPHACWQLANASAGSTLVFLDADVRVQPDGLARTLALLDDAGLDLVSPYPRQIARTPAERLVQPLLQWSWLTFLPLRLAERSPRPSLVAANGQLLACRRSGYFGAGGHAAVRGAVVEDMELARVVKGAGGRATVADGTNIAACRMYQSWAELRDGYSKSLWAMTRTTPGAIAVGALLAWLYCLPPAAFVWCVSRGRRAGVPFAGYAAGVAGRIITARATGGRIGDAPAHPVSILITLGLLGRSHVLRRRGRLTWRGRAISA